LGQGKVDLPAVLDLLEQPQDLKIIVVELDPSAKGAAHSRRDRPRQQGILAEAGIQVSIIRTRDVEPNPILDFGVDKAAVRYVGCDLQRPECILPERDGTLWPPTPGEVS
jgi:hypothetical protein